MRHFIITAALTATFAIQCIAQSIDKLPMTTFSGKRYYYYEVKGKETLYSVGRKLGVSQEQILQYNPTVYDGLKAGGRLYFPVEAFSPQSQASTAPTAKATSAAQAAPSQKEAKATLQGTKTHLVQRGETIYGISRLYGITTEALMDANPATRNGLKSGMSLVIPQARAIADTPSRPVATSTPNADTKNIQANDNIKEQATAEDTKRNSIDIAVLLPFDLDAENPGRVAQNSLEFYKGFLMAVDTLREFDRPIHVTTYDIGENDATVDAILAKPEMKNVSVIVAPPDPRGTVMPRLARFGRANQISVFNIFAVRDSLQQRNPYVMQANAPHNILLSKAVKGFKDRYSRYTPVFLIPNDVTADKAMFVRTLMSSLDKDGQKYKRIDYAGDLKESDIATLDQSTDYVFVPVQSSQRGLNRILDTLLGFKKNSVGDLSIFGYPEWITFRGETKENLHKLAATYYSRFVDDPDDRYTTKLSKSFEQWYGSPMATGLPRTAIMGFDSGVFLLRALKANNGNLNQAMPSYKGVQNGFKFRRVGSEDTGWINERVYLITYRPTGTIESEDL